MMEVIKSGAALLLIAIMALLIVHLVINIAGYVKAKYLAGNTGKLDTTCYECLGLWDARKIVIGCPDSKACVILNKDDIVVKHHGEFYLEVVDHKCLTHAYKAWIAQGRVRVERLSVKNATMMTQAIKAKYTVLVN